MDVKFNANYQVKVKLYESGINELRRQHEELNKVFPKANLPFSLNTDEQGYTSFQLWDLMARLGHMMSFAHETPFDLNIIITHCEEVKAK